MARRDRIRGEASLNINLTPLLDVVLQLITFFMMLIHFGTKLEGATRAVRLPVAPAALPGGDLAIDRLVVVVDARGRLVVDGGVIEREGSAAWWSGQAKVRRAGQETLGGPAEELPTVVIVRADRDASYGSIRRTLSEAQERGFAQFALVVLREREAPR
jgi:biopolymer transport protein ExbD